MIIDNNGITPYELAKQLGKTQLTKFLRQSVAYRPNIIHQDFLIDKAYSAVTIKVLVNREHAFLIIENLQPIKKIDVVDDRERKLCINNSQRNSTISK